MHARENTLRELIVRENTNVRLKASGQEDLALLQLRSKFRDEFEANLPRALHFL